MTSSAPAPTSNGSSAGPSIDPLPEFASLDLSLSRDQGTLHAAGYGAGSEAHTLSTVAEKHHSIVAERILSKSSAHAALGPENLPPAPTELPTLPKLTEGALNKQEDLLAPSSAAALANGAAITPGSSQQSSVAGHGSPSLGAPGVSSTQATLGVSRVGTPAPPAAVAQVGGAPISAVHPTSTSMAASKSGASSSTAGASGKAEKKSVFGKLFEIGRAHV